MDMKGNIARRGFPDESTLARSGSSALPVPPFLEDRRPEDGSDHEQHREGVEDPDGVVAGVG
jgi:hypothetical protein